MTDWRAPLSRPAKLRRAPKARRSLTLFELSHDLIHRTPSEPVYLSPLDYDRIKAEVMAIQYKNDLPFRLTDNGFKLCGHEIRMARKGVATIPAPGPGGRVTFLPALPAIEPKAEGPWEPEEE